MKGLIKINEWLNDVFTGIGGIALVVMTGIACVNMFLRLVGNPLAPAYELVSYLGAVTVAMPLGYAQLKKSHIAVDILSSRFNPGLRRVVQSVSLALSALFFGIISWKVAVHATNLWQAGELSETTRMAFYPFIYVVAVSCGLLCLCLVVDLLILVLPTQEENT